MKEELIITSGSIEYQLKYYQMIKELESLAKERNESPDQKTEQE